VARPVEDVEPWLEKLVANPRFLGRLGQREDDRANIILEVMARLYADGFHRLKLFVESRRTSPQLKFKTWLRVVTKRVGIDYMRGHQNYIDRRHDPDAEAPLANGSRQERFHRRASSPVSDLR